MDPVDVITATIKGVRLCLVDHEGVTRKMAQVKWSGFDASLYITSYCPPGGRAYAGRTPLRAVPEWTYDFSGQLEAADVMPKMSLHERGWATAELEGRKTEPARCEPFYSGAGHLATIKTFNPATLPVVEKKSKGASDVHIVTGGVAWTSVRVPLFVFEDEARARRHKHFLTFIRPHLAGPIYVAFDVLGEYEPHNDGDGVIVLGGWGVDALGRAVGAMTCTATKSN